MEVIVYLVKYQLSIVNETRKGILLHKGKVFICGQKGFLKQICVIIRFEF
jgi:hypothetical protein